MPALQSTFTAVSTFAASRVSLHTPTLGSMPFWVFSSFLVVLFGSAVTIDALLLVVMIAADMRGTHLVSPGIEIANYFWLGVQALLALDVMGTYLRYYRGGYDHTTSLSHGAQQSTSVSVSSFPQPVAWQCVTWCLQVELTPRKYLFLLALVLPMNVLLFYRDIGKVVYEPSVLSAFDVDGLLSSWPEGGGLRIGEETWAVDLISTNETLKVLLSDECYEPGSPEFQLMFKLRDDEIPKQAYCESTLGSMVSEAFRRTYPEMTWGHDDDIWEEGFEFAVRFFGAIGAVVADRQMGKGGFLEDMVDIFDMYMLAFSDKDQMIEGRHLFSNEVGPFWVRIMCFHTWVWVCLWIAYLTLILRALLLIGYTPARVSAFIESRMVAKEFQQIVSILMSLLFLEIPFILIRWFAWFDYNVPISVLALKNLFGLARDVHILGLDCCFVDRDARRRGLWKCLRQLTRSGSKLPLEEELGDAEQGEERGGSAEEDLVDGAPTALGSAGPGIPSSSGGSRMAPTESESANRAEQPLFFSTAST